VAGAQPAEQTPEEVRAPEESSPTSSTPARPSRLRIVKKSPTSLTFNYPHAPIEVEFSLPVRMDTVPSAFSVSPSVDGSFAWPAPNRVVFTPSRPWEMSASYRVSLGGGIKTADGLDELEATSWKFSTVGGYNYTRDIRPLLSAHCTQCHGEGGAAAHVGLGSHAAVMRFIRPGDAESSRFWAALADANHAGKLSPQAAARFYMLRDWITKFQAID